MPLASAEPFVLVLANVSGAILLDVRVGRGALQSGIWGWGPLTSGPEPLCPLIHTTAVTAPEHWAEILLPVL